MTMTIPTAEELAALPEMSLVVDAYGATCIRHHQTGDPLRDWVRVTPASSTVHHPPYLPAEVERVGWGEGPDQPTEPARCAPSREEIVRIWEDSVGDSGDAPSDDELVEFARALLASQRTEAEVKAEALREHRRRVVRFMPPGLVNRATVLADLDDYAERLAPTQPTPGVEAMGLPSVEVPSVGGERRRRAAMSERKVVTRPWRVERLDNYSGWSCLTTVATKERAEEGLAWYRVRGYGPLRARNRETGELIGGEQHG